MNHLFLHQLLGKLLWKYLHRRPLYKRGMGESSIERPIPSERPPNFHSALHFLCGRSSHNSLTYGYTVWKAMCMYGCSVMMLHFENVRLGWSWAVAHWVPVTHWSFFPYTVLYTTNSMCNLCKNFIPHWGRHILYTPLFSRTVIFAVLARCSNSRVVNFAILLMLSLL